MMSSEWVVDSFLEERNHFAFVLRLAGYLICDVRLDWIPAISSSLFIFVKCWFKFYSKIFFLFFSKNFVLSAYFIEREYSKHWVFSNCAKGDVFADLKFQ